MSHNFLTYDLKLDLYYKIVHAGDLTHWVCYTASCTRPWYLIQSHMKQDENLKEENACIRTEATSLHYSNLHFTI